MNKPLSFRQEAVDEAQEARRWFAKQRREAADGFLRELRTAYDAMAVKPSIYPFYEAPYRFYRLKRYPYLVIDHERDDVVDILAVAHAKREPGYWKRRSDS